MTMESKHKTKNALFITVFLLYIVNSLYAYDFSSVSPSGQTIYYKIVLDEAQVVSQSDRYPFNYTYPIGDLIIPDSVEHDGIKYPVTSIGSSAFVSCSDLTSISLPESIREIYQAAFSGCRGLTSFTIPSSVRIIYYYAFASCSNLSTIYFNAENCIYMDASEGNRIFDGCTNLVKVVIGDNVTNIPEKAFRNCHSLDTVVLLPQVPPTLGNNAFAGNAPTRKFYVPCGLYDAYSSYSPRTEPNGPDFTLTVQTNNSNLGTVSIMTNGENDILCDSSAVIQANTIEPNHFLKWDNGSTSQTDNIFVSCDTTITAIFVNLTVNTNNNAFGTAVHEKQSNLVEKIQAIPNSEYHFDHWSNGCTLNPCLINLTSDSLVTAFFMANESPEGISDGFVESIKLYQHDGNIVVSGAAGHLVALYDMSGHLLETKRSEAEELYFDVANNGVYHVKIGDFPARKIVVIK